MPFTGDSRFTRASQGLLVGQLLGQSHFRIVQPDIIEAKAKSLQISFGQNELTTLELTKVGTIVDAHAVVSGHITSYNNGATLKSEFHKSIL